MLRRVRRWRRRLTGGLVSGPKSLADNIRHFSNPGPHFEEQDALSGQHLDARARTIAFYLPQFHAFAENDEWWGNGFTEWRNVARGTPRFKGHYQPRIPRDLGFYDLNNIDTIRAQFELARHNGIDAFCFYYYWFNGKRLMEKPLDLLLDSDIDQSFCIMWANENWTRTWDGMDDHVLIKQDYDENDEDAFIADTATYMSDSRYVCVGQQPLFILYRPGLLPDAKNTLARWRKKWSTLLGVEPLIMMVQGFGEEDPRAFGLDGAVEFPPHKVCAGLKNINDRCQLLDSHFNGLVKDYDDVVNKSLSEPAPEFPLIKTVSPHWDNDARREGLGMTLQGSTPEKYERWLNGVIDFSRDNPVNGESLVFINAWNEWAEGAYLEPDVYYGHAYLNATKRAITGLSQQTPQFQGAGAMGVDNGVSDFTADARQLDGPLLLVGHDAYRHGAQMLLLNIAKVMRQQFGQDIIIALKEGGPLLGDYQNIAKTIVLNKKGRKALKKLLASGKIQQAICNTTVTGDVVAELRSHNIRVVSLIHEMPTLIRDYKLERQVSTIASQANHVVFPAELVKNGFVDIAGDFKSNAVVRPQGTYHPIEFDADARLAIRAELGIPANAKMVLGVGYADLRKGFDLFMQSARRLVSAASDSSAADASTSEVHFVWAGALSSDMQRWFANDFGDLASATDTRVHLVGHTDNISAYYSAADCLFLPSREDPYPTVVLEAMNIGLPVVLFHGTTGFDQLLDELGFVVPFGDSMATDKALLAALNESDTEIANARAEHVDTACQFDDYCFDLLQLLDPGLQRISVVVPNYNYAHYLEQRLTSVFAQRYPVFETILLDDNSSDGSVGIARRIARQAKRTVRIVANEQNSGSAFKQWTHAAHLARGEVLWIAEADDSAKPQFLEQLLVPFKQNTAMVFCDSAQIGLHGEHLSKSYAHYYRKAHPSLFESSFTKSGRSFVSEALSVRNTIMNVSSVLWRKSDLSAALAQVSGELDDLQLVGDWRLYLEVLLQSESEISYVNEALNVHRRHQSSLTRQIDPKRHLAEIRSVHAHIGGSLKNNRSLIDSMQVYQHEVAAELGVIESESAYDDAIASDAEADSAASENSMERDALPSDDKGNRAA